MPVTRSKSKLSLAELIEKAQTCNEFCTQQKESISGKRSTESDTGEENLDEPAYKAKYADMAPRKNYNNEQPAKILSRCHISIFGFVSRFI